MLLIFDERKIVDFNKVWYQFNMDYRIQKIRKREIRMEIKKYLEEEIQHFLVNVGWTHKIQICQSELYVLKIKRLKVLKIILTAITSVGLGSALLKIFSEYSTLVTIISLAFSLSLSIVIALDKENDYKKLANQNKVDSDKFLELRECALELLYKLKMNSDVNDINKEFSKLKKLRRHINVELSYTSPKAVKLATKKIKDNKDNDYSKDYKYFIPKNLRYSEDEL
ncbi:hypothetical protein AWJ03_14595 [Listeria monocytogenes]|nr:hypothetical protein AWJ03_14595 [Listeria monocytogenes]